MSRHSRVRIVRTMHPVIGELRWSVLPLDLKTQGKDDTRRRATLIRVTAFNEVNGRVGGSVGAGEPSAAAPASVW